jgi:hypothetical protein
MPNETLAFPQLRNITSREYLTFQWQIKERGAKCLPVANIIFYTLNQIQMDNLAPTTTAIQAINQSNKSLITTSPPTNGEH